MSLNHGCVWIDHREARIFRIGRGETESQVVHDQSIPHRIHRSADHLGLGKLPMDPGFLAQVAEGLSGYKAIAIFGPGNARTELAGYLAEHYPSLARRIWGIEPMDHPSDRQIVAAAQEYFRAAERMHT